MKIYLSHAETITSETNPQKRYKLLASFKEDFTPEYELDSYVGEAAFFKLIENTLTRINNWGNIHLFSINGDSQEDSKKHLCNIKEITVSADLLLLAQKHAWKKTFEFDMPISFIEAFNTKTISTAPDLLDGL